MQPTMKVPALLPVLIKGGLNSATRALALELASSNVKVSAVAGRGRRERDHAAQAGGRLRGQCELAVRQRLRAPGVPGPCYYSAIPAVLAR